MWAVMHYLLHCPSYKIFGTMKQSLPNCQRTWWKSLRNHQLQSLGKISRQGNNTFLHIKFIAIIQNQNLNFAVNYRLLISLRYITNHHLHKLNGNPNLDYLGHPINAYHFIRHVASGWKRILNDGPQIDNWISNNVGSIVWNDLLVISKSKLQ